jgi:hypothetical protein
MNVDLSYEELKYAARKIGWDSWQSDIAKSIESKLKAVIPKAKELEDASNKANKIASLKKQLSELESDT